VKRYSGIIPALITPFASDGSINERALRELLDFNLGKGVEAFYVCGSSGEAFLMSLQERKRVFKIVADQVAGQVPLICHVGNINTWSAVELARHAEEHGAMAISSIPPFYYDFSEEEIKQYYLDLIEAIDLPMIVYNFPDFSGVSINTANAAELLRHEAVLGIKHTSNDMFEIGKIKKLDDALVVFSGFDQCWVSAMAMGADSAIGSTYNVMPEKAIAMQSAFAAGRVDEAWRIQMVANEVIMALLEVGVFNGIKYLLHLQGIDAGSSRAPFKPLTSAQQERLKGVLPLISGDAETQHAAG
jgi:N-acetylneuraminate lyase